jgi:hypothetical protein
MVFSTVIVASDMTAIFLSHESSPKPYFLKTTTKSLYQVKNDVVPSAWEEGSQGFPFNLKNFLPPRFHHKAKQS